MAPLFADLYLFTMLRAYQALGMQERATFSLFVRKLPPCRNYLVACGLADALAAVESLRFASEDIEYLSSLGLFPPPFLDSLKHFRFSGDIDAVPEGSPAFANEPLLEVTAPIGEAQLLETFLANQIGLQTMLATKAARVVRAAQGRPVVDFGSRRAQGLDAAVKGARAFAVAGVAATSNLMAGRRDGLPVAGTVAHSFIEAFDSEDAAFERFAALYPNTILLVDTYDTLEAVRKIVRLHRAGRLGPIRGIRLDSGDLDPLSRQARALLDEGGLSHVQIFASGGLDENRIEALVAAGSPVDAFGIGTAMSVSRDAPDLDIVYKLTEYGGRGRMKLSAGKRTYPGRKQVFREMRDGRYRQDTLALRDEGLPGEPLLQPVMRDGAILPAGIRPLGEIRRRAAEALAQLPDPVAANAPAATPYPVAISESLGDAERRLREALVRTRGEGPF